ncbi:MAG: hypothetical protein ACE5I8_02740 [Thermodesulfobacteriota bacterium]
MPTPNQVKTLRIVMELEEVNKEILARRMGVTSDYAGYLLRCLWRDGYLENGRAGIYRLTPKGGEALFGVLFQLRERLTAKIRWSSWLRDRATARMDGLEKFLIGKFPNERD